MIHSTFILDILKDTMSFVPTPKVSGGDRPEPFNENDENRITSDILHNIGRLDKRCFYPSELIMEEEMEAAMAYHNPQEKEKALLGEPTPFYKQVTYCLERLVEKGILKKEVKVDQSDGTRYTLYCKTDLYEEVKPQIMAVQLAVIDKILEEYKERKKRQSG
jgi:hypothetical protein